MSLRLFNILLLTVLLGPACHAHADAALTAVKYDPALDFKGIYEFSYIGIVFGKMGIEARRTPDRYAITADVASTGLINLFTRHTSHTTVEGTGQHFTYSDIRYETHYRTKNKPRYVKLLYKNGALAEEIALPPEDPKKRPPVSPAMKNAAADPLSFALAMRQQLADVLRSGKNDFRLSVYDGRRLTGAEFSIMGQENLRYKGRQLPVIEIEARRKPLAGFTASELEDYSPHEPVLHIYFTDDARLIPIRLEIRLWFGTVAATLVRECGEAENCLLGMKD